ncbi:MAG: NAD(P)-dependent glycerol-3-phosphate dehydrogenase [Candidatus Omnitrophica bacterium]|nr:NAD(P)-dependent glycerol-3-phosphate dehydrogenase [Candidatus Omnitrophota bacterium]
MLNIAVLGDGGWGTTLAVLLSKKGHKVSLWGAFRDYVSVLDSERVNWKFLPGISIPADILITSDIKDAAAGKDIIILAVPSQYLRGVLKKLKGCCGRGAVFVSVTKGIENRTLMRMTEVARDVLGNIRIAALSGPTIAREVAEGMPTTVVVASADRKMNTFLQDVFSTEKFRVYTNNDLAGVELGGSVKNIIAIACGISDGLGFGTNTKAAIVSRGLVEMKRLGAAMGAKEKTFSGISGLGDLVTTCISPFSRNRSVGEQIGKGRKLPEIINRLKMVAEGVPTAKSVFQLSKKYAVEMPIAAEIYKVIYRNKSPRQAVYELMTRSKKGE